MEEQKNNAKWKIRDAFRLIGNSISAILHAQFLIRLNAGRFFLHIAYTFLLIGLIILFSLQIEGSLNKMEKNKRRLHAMELLYQEKTFEVATLSRRSTVLKTLEQMGSPLREPESPATKLKK